MELIWNARSESKRMGKRKINRVQIVASSGLRLRNFCQQSGRRSGESARASGTRVEWKKEMGRY